ncbi:MAG: FG-GAP repeat domain-containing protein, partial [Bryobacteraceae bacterium]
PRSSPQLLPIARHTLRCRVTEDTYVLVSSVSYRGTTIKKYALNYEQSPTTGRDELTQVQECADADATNCLPPTTFTYRSGQIGVSTSAATAGSGTGIQLRLHNDFNGDGFEDLAYCNNASPNVVYVIFGSASGYGSPVNTGISCAWPLPLYGDLNASGKDGIFAVNGTDWWYYSWDGSSFLGQDTALPYNSQVSQYVLADVNGDGLPDLISYVPYSIYVRLNASLQSSVRFSSSNSIWYGPLGYTTGVTMFSNTDGTNGANLYGTLKSFDFNGDGRQDIALQVVGGSGQIDEYELISGSSSFSAVPVAAVGAISSPTFLDFNSDGCTDYAYGGTIYVSGCNGTVAEEIGLGGVSVIGAMDWNGDGYTDILVQNGSTIGVYLSEGNGISSLQSTSIPYNSSDVYFAFDADGDGLDDLGFTALGTVC